MYFHFDIDKLFTNTAKDSERHGNIANVQNSCLLGDEHRIENVF